MVMLMTVLQLQKRPIAVRGCTDQQKEGGERARPQNQWWSNNIGSNIMVSRFLVPIRHQTGVSHLLSYLRSHQKRNTQVSILFGTQNVKNVSDICVDSSLQKKRKNQHINKHAFHISANLGHVNRG